MVKNLFRHKCISTSTRFLCKYKNNTPKVNANLLTKSVDLISLLKLSQRVPWHMICTGNPYIRCYISGGKRKQDNSWAPHYSPLNSPLMPPIFFTIWANFLYCVSSSLTSLTETPAPRATRCVRPACFVNNLSPSKLSSSNKI